MHIVCGTHLCHYMHALEHIGYCAHHVGRMCNCDSFFILSWCVGNVSRAGVPILQGPVDSRSVSNGDVFTNQLVSLVIEDQPCLSVMTQVPHDDGVSEGRPFLVEVL